MKLPAAFAILINKGTIKLENILSAITYTPVCAKWALLGRCFIFSEKNIKLILRIFNSHPIETCWKRESEDCSFFPWRSSS